MDVDGNVDGGYGETADNGLTILNGRSEVPHCRCLCCPVVDEKVNCEFRQKVVEIFDLQR